MTTNSEELRAQLDHLARLADRGRMIPLLSGAYFVIWGLVVSVAGAAAYLAIGEGRIDMVGPIWGAAVVVGWVVAAFAGRRLRLRSREGVASYGNEVTRVTWLAAGLSITGYLVAAEVAGGATTSVSVVALLLSGMAIVASASASGTRLLYVSGAALILLALADVAFVWSAASVNAIVSAAGLLFLALPGVYLVLRRREVA